MSSKLVGHLGIGLFVLGGTILLVFLVVAISEQGQFVNNAASDILAFILGMLSLGCGLYLIIKDATSRLVH